MSETMSEQTKEQRQPLAYSQRTVSALLDDLESTRARVEQLESELASSRRDTERLRLHEQQELAVRREWWLSHGCGMAALYGDDGEMQCSGCLVDFLRTPPIAIAAQLRNAKMLRRSSTERGQDA